MNPQKNQGAEDSALLRDLQAEVSSESAPLLQFILRHGGAIAGFVVLFVLVLAGTGLWRWYDASRNDEARQELARISMQPAGAEQVKALTALAEKAPDAVRFAAWLAVGQGALRGSDAAAAAAAFARAAGERDGAFGLAASLDEAGALLKAGRNAEALALLQKLLASLPGEMPAPQLRQMTAEAAAAAGKPDEAARMYLALAREAQGLDSDYFRSRARALSPKTADEDGAAGGGSAAPQAGAEKEQSRAQ